MREDEVKGMRDDGAFEGVDWKRSWRCRVVGLCVCIWA